MVSIGEWCVLRRPGAAREQGQCLQAYGQNHRPRCQERREAGGTCLKELGKDIGHGTSKTVKDVGQGMKESAERTGKAAKEAVK